MISAFCCCCSSSISTEDGPGLSSDENGDILEDNETAFIPYDEELKPVAIVEEAAAYKQSDNNGGGRPTQLLSTCLSHNCSLEFGLNKYVF